MIQVKSWIKEHASWIAIFYRRAKISKIKAVHFSKVAVYRTIYGHDSIFSLIYQKNMWGQKPEIGSPLDQTGELRRHLPIIVKKIGARSILDAACGDFLWMKELSLDIDRYIGVDIVPELVERNRKKYGSQKVSFLKADITKDPLPEVDLIICRDVLVHLSCQDVQKAIANFKKSNGRFLLTTTYPNLGRKNGDTITGMWRPIDFQRPPYNFPPPLELINEGCNLQTDYPEKSLGLWDLGVIPLK